MRVDDDVVWGSGRQHGLNHPRTSPAGVVSDFLEFSMLAVRHR